MTANRKGRPPLLVPPPTGSTDVEYLNARGQWVPWDGTVKAARAWSYLDGRFPAASAWDGCDEHCGVFANCVHRKAMDRTCDRWRCANGRIHREARSRK